MSSLHAVDASSTDGVIRVLGVHAVDANWFVL